MDPAVTAMQQYHFRGANKSNANKTHKDAAKTASERNPAAMTPGSSTTDASVRRRTEYNTSKEHPDSRNAQLRREYGTNGTQQRNTLIGGHSPDISQRGSRGSVANSPILLDQEGQFSGQRHATRSGQVYRMDGTGRSTSWSNSGNRQQVQRSNAHLGLGPAQHRIQQKFLRERDQLYEANQNLRAANDKQENELRQSEAICKQMESELQVISSKREEDKKRIEALEATVRKCQATQLQSVESTKWMPFATSELQHQLGSIQTSIRKWAKECSKMPFEQFIQECEQIGLVAGVFQRKIVSSPQQLVHALLCNETMHKPGRASALLLGSLASETMLTSIIEAPFFACVGEGDDTNTLPHSIGGSLGGLVHLISQSNEAGAEALRCQALRLLDPPSDATDTRTTAAKTIARRSRVAASRWLAGSFMKQYSGAFADHERGHALSKLEAIFEEAAELSAQLWTRKARFEITQPGPGDFEPHAMHVKELEDDSTALDSKEPILFCDLAVVMEGNADGENFHERRLIKKGIAWLG